MHLDYIFSNKPKPIDKKQMLEIMETSATFDPYDHFKICRGDTFEAGYHTDMIEDFIYAKYGAEDDYMYICLCQLKSWEDKDMLTMVMKFAVSSQPLYKYWSQRIFDGKLESYCKVVTEGLNKIQNLPAKSNKKKK